jgi:hypothetical protein
MPGRQRRRQFERTKAAAALRAFAGRQNRLRDSFARVIGMKEKRPNPRRFPLRVKPSRIANGKPVAAEKRFWLAPAVFEIRFSDDVIHFLCENRELRILFSVPGSPFPVT